VDMELFDPLCYPIAYLVQYHHDKISKDSRLTGLSQEILETEKRECINSIRSLYQYLPADSVPIFNRMETAYS
jgi:hypothetical protein